MTLPEKLAAFRANFEAGGPPFNAPSWIHEVMHRATDELIASGAAGKALKVGNTAPVFTLVDADGRKVSSKDLLADGPLIITFYRGVWCPYCNMDLQAIQEALPELASRGAKVIAISPQTAPNSRRSQRENKLSFAILSDPGNEVAAAFGLRFRLPDYLQTLYKDAFKNDLEVANGEPSLDAADAGALRHRPGRRHPLRRGQSGLHDASRPATNSCRCSTRRLPWPLEQGRPGARAGGLRPSAQPAAGRTAAIR